MFGTISILHLAAGGQAAVNNDSGRAHKLLVSGKKSNPEKAEEGSAYQMGSKFQLPTELQKSLLIHSKEYAPVHKKGWINALSFNLSLDKKLNKRKIERRRKEC